MLPRLLKKIAPRIGARVTIEPQWGVVGQITFRNRKKSYFRYNTLDLNPVGSSDVAKDKDYATFFMKRMGYKTVIGRAFYSDEWCDAIGSKQNIEVAVRYTKKIGFPLFVKPNSGSHGTNVFRVETVRELRTALNKIFKNDRIALVQKPVEGRDYRIVVLDDKIISAYQRIPINVIGDGRSTIAQLLKKKQREFIASSRDSRIKFDDARIVLKLKHQKLTFRSIPKKGEKIFLLENANLSSGGDAIDVTNKIHPKFKQLAIKLTKDMGLRLCGVDLIVDGTITDPPKKYRVLEVNAAPGLDHYVKTGNAQQKIVEEMYLKVLKSLKA